MQFNNETLSKAVNQWIKDKESALAKYGHISNWDTSQVTDMSGLFLNEDQFNEALNDWDVSNVEDMTSMFEGASSFNQPLDNWDVSSVDYFVAMFSRASSFNQPLNMWDIQDFAKTDSMFSGADSFNKEWASISTPKFKKEIKILNCRHEPRGDWDDTLFFQLMIDSKIESIMVQIDDETDWYVYYGGEYTTKSDSSMWIKEFPEGLTALPNKLLGILFDMLYEIEIKNWPESLIGRVIE